MVELVLLSSLDDKAVAVADDVDDTDESKKGAGAAITTVKQVCASLLFTGGIGPAPPTLRPPTPPVAPPCNNLPTAAQAQYNNHTNKQVQGLDHQRAHTRAYYGHRIE